MGIVCATLLLCVAPKTAFSANVYTGLINFTGATGSFPGTGPGGTFALSGSTLYGTTQNGGTSSDGVLYAYNTSNGAYSVLVDFTGVAGSFPGISPNSVTLLGNVIYGTTFEGGTGSFGVLYSYDLGTNTYTEIFNFTGTSGAHPGERPQSNLVFSGSVLYGLASGGGTSSDGVLFSYDTGTSTYTPLVQFTGNAGLFPGSDPISLILSGNIIYGTTLTGGSSGDGVVFSYNIGTSAYNVLINFTGNAGAAPGIAPNGPLVLLGNTLYGTTGAGGTTDIGVVFSYDIGTATYSELFNFTGNTGSFPGDSPESGLSVVGTVLYGTTSAGGAAGDGVLYSYDTATSTYTDLFEFSDTPAAPGSAPAGTVTPIGNVLYGTANGGGTSGDGVLFSFGPPVQQGGGSAGKKKKKHHRPSHHPRPAPVRTPKYKEK
jgi:uncharacterized repeat protein (TIGR03803 family)